MTKKLSQLFRARLIPLLLASLFLVLTANVTKVNATQDGALDAPTAIDAYGSNFCGITATHRIRCWQSEDSGRNEQATLLQSQNMTKLKDVWLGRKYACVLMISGLVKCTDGRKGMVSAPFGKLKNFTNKQFFDKVCGSELSGAEVCWRVGSPESVTYPLPDTAPKWTDGSYSQFCQILGGRITCDYGGQIGPIWTSPLEIGDIQKASRQLFSTNRMCALNSDQNVFCWEVCLTYSDCHFSDLGKIKNLRLMNESPVKEFFGLKSWGELDDFGSFDDDKETTCFLEEYGQAKCWFFANGKDQIVNYLDVERKYLFPKTSDYTTLCLQFTSGILACNGPSTCDTNNLPDEFWSTLYSLKYGDEITFSGVMRFCSFNRSENIRIRLKSGSDKWSSWANTQVTAENVLKYKFNKKVLQTTSIEISGIDYNVFTLAIPTTSLNTSNFEPGSGKKLKRNSEITFTVKPPAMAMTFETKRRYVNGFMQGGEMTYKVKFDKGYNGSCTIRVDLSDTHNFAGVKVSPAYSDLHTKYTLKVKNGTGQATIIYRWNGNYSTEMTCQSPLYSQSTAYKTGSFKASY